MASSDVLLIHLLDLLSSRAAMTLGLGSGTGEQILTRQTIIAVQTELATSFD